MQTLGGDARLCQRLPRYRKVDYSAKWTEVPARRRYVRAFDIGIATWSSGAALAANYQRPPDSAWVGNPASPRQV